MLFLCSLQPPTEPHTPHGPRLPETEMLPEQMYHDPHIIHLQSTNTHTPKAYHRQTPILKPAAVCSAPSPAAANSVSSFKSLPKALICSFSSAGRVPAPKPVNHPDELSASKQPLAPGWGNRKATTADQWADGEHNQSAIREKEMFAVLFE